MMDANSDVIKALELAIEEGQVYRDDYCPECTPEFDVEKCRGLSSSEVRKKYPRFSGHCNSCGFYGAKYANTDHFTMGDW